MQEYTVIPYIWNKQHFCNNLKHTHTYTALGAHQRAVTFFKFTNSLSSLYVLFCPTMPWPVLSTHTSFHWTTRETCTCLKGSTPLIQCCHSYIRWLNFSVELGQSWISSMLSLFSVVKVKMETLHIGPRYRIIPYIFVTEIVLTLTTNMK